LIYLNLIYVPIRSFNAGFSRETAGAPKRLRSNNQDEGAGAVTSHHQTNARAMAGVCLR
jgi:hypothetical protein